MSKIKVDKIESVDGTKVLITKDMFKALPTAWVNFDGTLTGTITPRDSYNIASVVRSGAGVYEITFSTPMNNANYVLGGSCGDINPNRTGKLGMGDNDVPTITTFTVRLYNAGNTTMDSKKVSVIIIGGKD